jgi:hypothetical protein
MTLKLWRNKKDDWNLFAKANGKELYLTNAPLGVLLEFAVEWGRG